jgi:hypothetical protein
MPPNRGTPLGAFLAADMGAETYRIKAMAERLPKLVSRLRKFSFPLVAELLAGLLTLPENHAAAARIEALIHLSAMVSRGTEAPTRQQLREWLNEIVFRDSLRTLEDPVEDVFVSNVPSWSGNIRLFEGGWIDNDFYTRSCLAVLTRLSERPWAKKAILPAAALLCLSEAIANRSGVKRYALSERLPGEPIRVSPDTVERSRKYIKFTFEDLKALDCPVAALNAFAFQTKFADELSEQSLGHSALERRPLIFTNDAVFVVLPTSIGAAVRRFILELATEAGELDVLESAISEAQFADLHELGLSGWKIAIGESPTVYPSGVREVVGTFDRGGYVHVVFVPDRLAEVVQSGLRSAHSIIDLIEDPIETRTAKLSASADYHSGLTLVVHGGIGRGFAAAFKEAPSSWQRLALPISDFMRLASDADLSALRAWKLLEQEDALPTRGVTISSIDGFLTLYSFAQNQDFEIVPKQMKVDPKALGLMQLATDFLAPLRHRLRAAVDQHIVKGPDNKSWIEVQRATTSAYFKEAEQWPVFVSLGALSSGRLLGCVETPARPWWAECVDLPDAKHLRAIVSRAWEMTRDWLVAVAPAMESVLPEVSGLDSVAYLLVFPDIDSLSERQLLEPGGRTDPIVDLEENKIRISCPNSYFRNFADADNIGDRLMVRALVSGAFLKCGRALTVEEADAIAEDIVGSRNARFLHMVPAHTPSEVLLTAVASRSPRFVQPEDRGWSRLGLTYEAGWLDPPGAIPLTKARSLLAKSVDVLWGRIKQRLLELDRFSVVEHALENHDAIENDRMQWRLTAAALLALYKDTPDVLSAAIDREGQRALTGIACRVIIEMAICTSACSGGRPCADADLDFLVAQIATLLDCAGQSDAIYFGLTHTPPIAYPNGSFGFDTAFVQSLQQPYVAAHGEKRFRAAAEEYPAAFESLDNQGKMDTANSGFNSAFAEEFGLGLEQYGTLVAKSTDAALDQRRRLLRLSKDNFISILKEVGASDPQRTYAALVLPSRPKWDQSRPENAMARDWYPWRYHRRLSLTRRPVVELAKENAEVLVSPLLLERSAVYFVGAALGRLPVDIFESTEMRSWIGSAVDREGHAFNDSVAKRIAELGWSVLTEVQMTQLGAAPNLGDIDVLAWRVDAGKAYAIECKRLMFDRTAGEIGERIVEYGTITATGQRTPIQKHLDRMKYLRSNLNALSDLTGIELPKLELRSGLVTDYVAPMQFSKAVSDLVDLSSDYDSLAAALEDR